SDQRIALLQIGGGDKSRFTRPKSLGFYGFHKNRPLFRRVGLIPFENFSIFEKLRRTLLTFPDTQQSVNAPVRFRTETNLAATSHQFVKSKTLDFAHIFMGKLHLTESPYFGKHTFKTK